MDGAACGMVTGNCSYTGSDCACGNSHNWNCRATLICPAAKPTVGDACTTAQGTCDYGGMGACRCGQSEKWTCAGGNPAACPATQPTAGNACMGNTQCAYATADCICLSQKWACN
jgi:hypothetical protein